MKYSYLLPLLGVLALAGCGPSVSEKVGQEIAEKAIESSTGGQADVDINADGGATIETAEGKFQSGDDLSLPSDWPSDVYVIDGKVKAVIAGKEGSGTTISIEADGAIKDIAATYKNELESDGWKISGTMDFGTSASVIAEKDDRNVSVMIGEGDEKTSVVLSISKQVE